MALTGIFYHLILQHHIYNSIIGWNFTPIGNMRLRKYLIHKLSSKVARIKVI